MWRCVTAFPLLYTYVLCAALSWLVYWPGLDGGFLFDDYHVIVDNPTLALAADSLPTGLLDAALSTATGPLKRPLSLLTFALNRSIFGPGPRSFKITNLLIHCVNVALLLMLLTRLVPYLFDSPHPSAGPLAALVVLAWAVHPINLTAVLYVVQRMTLLASMCMLAGLLAYVCLRQRQIVLRPLAGFWWLAPWFFWLLGSGCKETAVLLPAYILVTEVLCLRGAALPWVRRFWPIGTALCLVPLAAIAVALWPSLTADYAMREYSLGQRLLTECQVVVTYVQMLVLPDVRSFALFHDDVGIARALFESPATTLSAVMVISGVAVALLGRPRLLSFGVAWFFAGHMLESTVLPLELMHEHRNYLPGIGILLIFVVGLDAGARRFLPSKLRFLPVLIGVVFFAGVTAQRAEDWSAPWPQMALEAHDHPRSARSIYEFGRLTVERGTASADQGLIRRGIDAIASSTQMSPNPRPYLAYGALLNLAINNADADETHRWLTFVRVHESSEIRVEVLVQVIECQAYAGCRADSSAVLELAAAVLGDEIVTDGQRRHAVEWLALYYLRVLDDRDAGLRMLRDLAEQQPRDVAVKLRLAEALLAGKAGAESRLLAADISEHLPWHAQLSDRPTWRRVQRLLAAVAGHDEGT